MENTKTSKKEFLYIPVIVFMLAQIGTSGDSNILNVSIKSIMETLNATLNDIQLATMIYSMCAAAFMVSSGMLGLIIGFKNNFRIGAFLCMIGEFLLAISPNIYFFTWVGRVAVGIGGSLLIPSVLALIVQLYEKEKRAQAFGFIAAASGISYLTPLLAGIILDYIGFRISFFIMSIYFFIVFIGSFSIPTNYEKENIKFDFIGSILTGLGLFLVLIGISKIPQWGFIKPINPPFKIFNYSPNIFMISIGIIILIFLIFLEKYKESKGLDVILPKTFLFNKQVRAGLLMCVVTFYSLGAFGLLMPSFVQLVALYNSIQTGIIFMMMGIPTFIFSIILPKKFKNLSIKYSIIIGLLVLTLSSFLISLSLKNNGVTYLFFISVILYGIFISFISIHASNIVASAIDIKYAKQSGGIQATSRNAGIAIAIAILSMFMISFFSNDIKNKINSSNLPNDIKLKVLNLNIQYEKNEDFLKKLNNNNISNEFHNEIVTIYSNSKLKSSKFSFIILGISFLLFLPCIKNIPHKLFE